MKIGVIQNHSRECSLGWASLALYLSHMRAVWFLGDLVHFVHCMLVHDLSFLASLDCDLQIHRLFSNARLWLLSCSFFLILNAKCWCWFGDYSQPNVERPPLPATQFRPTLFKTASWLIGGPNQRRSRLKTSYWLWPIPTKKDRSQLSATNV